MVKSTDRLVEAVDALLARRTARHNRMAAIHNKASDDNVDTAKDTETLAIDRWRDAYLVLSEQEVEDLEWLMERQHPHAYTWQSPGLVDDLDWS